MYTDFSKAFDKINHYKLICKLSMTGIHGDLLRWLKSYIDNRSQAVALKGYTSKFLTVPSGVPQGSHLGPLLFTLYINDIGSSFSNSSHLLYADDTKIFKIIKSPQDCLDLQADLDSFASFCTQNQLYLNPDKCHTITFSRRRNPVTYSYNINGSTLNRVTKVRDLGIILDAGLHYNLHIDSIVGKAYKRLGLIYRLSRPFKQARTLETLYNAYVRSVLEFGCVVWSPQYSVHKRRIERINNKFLKYLDYRTGYHFQNYDDTAKRHNVTSLETRRLYHDALFLFKIINGIIDCSDLLSKITFRIPRISSRSTETFYISFCKSNYASNSFVRRSCSSYNDNLQHVDIFNCSLNLFKKGLSELLLN